MAETAIIDAMEASFLIKKDPSGWVVALGDSVATAAG